ncbi:MAG: tryptophan--tRNA ligase [bacterium]|nr:tryptophan--tRNA ligase [bacterium]
MAKRIFSGIQPSGIIHIGNYLGAIKQWVELQNNPPTGEDEAIFCIVDLHAITVRQNPEQLRKNTLSAAAWYIACGINPQKSDIFIQSTRPEHTELAWILSCYTQIGELARMTQYKEKTQKLQNDLGDTGFIVKAAPSAGLLTYPTLMAADILLYQTTTVPVGEDQVQHVELTRDIAKRFNNLYGQTFTIPDYSTKISGKRIMALDDPSKKMSKSAASEYNYMALSDSPEKIRQKIRKAVTDSGTQVKYEKDQPAISNLLNIHSEISGKEVAELEDEFSSKNYGEFKEALADTIISHLAPIQSKYNSLMQSPTELEKILKAGSEKVASTAQKTLSDVKTKIGLLNL